jgi:hypothetical protein
MNYDLDPAAAVRLLTQNLSHRKSGILCEVEVVKVGELFYLSSGPSFGLLESIQKGLLFGGIVGFVP